MVSTKLLGYEVLKHRRAQVRICSSLELVYDVVNCNFGLHWVDGMADDTKSLLDAAHEQGWRIERTKKGHWRCLAPDGKNIVILSGTPSDRRSMRNAIAQMRRYGFQWEGH